MKLSIIILVLIIVGLTIGIIILAKSQPSKSCPTRNCPSTSGSSSVCQDLLDIPSLQTKSTPTICARLSKNVFLIQGNIAEPPFKVDAVVNAGNTQLSTGSTWASGSGGVTGALIKAVGGQEKWEELFKNSNSSLWSAPTSTGLDKVPEPIDINVCQDVVITPIPEDDTQLQYKYIVHVAGPNCGKGDDENTLADCYKNALKAVTAFDNNIESIIFPYISGGVYSCDQATTIALETLLSVSDEYSDLQIFIIKYN